MHRGVRTTGERGHRPPQHFNWGAFPCNFEPWHWLIKAAKLMMNSQI